MVRRQMGGSLRPSLAQDVVGCKDGGRNSRHHTHHDLDFALAIVYLLVFFAGVTTPPTIHQWVVGVFTILTENAHCESLVFCFS